MRMRLRVRLRLRRWLWYRVKVKVRFKVRGRVSVGSTFLSNESYIGIQTLATMQPVWAFGTTPEEAQGKAGLGLG